MKSSDKSTLAVTQKLRQAKLKITPQRLEIYRALLEHTGHASPEELYQILHSALPSCTLATIYRTLELFSQAGLIVPVLYMGSKKRYENRLKPHHHFVCMVCQKIQDLPLETLTVPQVPKKLSGCTVFEVQVHFMGLCETCVSKNKKRDLQS
ncbi:MAG: transcriptional repressor [Planctomycetota bacterium]